MKRITLFLLFIVAVFVAFLLHVVIQEWRIALITPEQMTFPMKVKFWGGVSDYLPATASLLVLYYIWDYVPGRSWWQKGIVFAVFILTLRGGFFIPVIIGFVEGLALTHIVIGELDVWIPKLIWGLSFAFIVHAVRQRRDNAPPV